MQRRIPVPAAQRGFSLIELVVVVTMVGILAAIAFSSYQGSVLSSRRTDAKTAILDIAAREERFFSTNNSYTNVPSQLGYTGAAFPIVVGSGYYQAMVPPPQAAVQNTTVVPPTYTPASYTVIVTPIGTQTNDSACVTYTLQSNGQIQVLNSAGNDNTAACM
jgi:type IV pilus assembly protein PilE